MFSHVNPQAIDCAQHIKLLVLDVDGVLTTGQLFIAPSGEVIKPFNTLDGHGLKLLMQTGVHVAIITARSDKAVAFRAQQLGIKHYFYGIDDKKQAYELLLKQLDLTPAQCAMIGDDVIDMPILNLCALPIAVQNAHDWVKQHCLYITQKSGGMGAVREVCDMIMYAQGTLNSILNGYRQ